VCVGLFFSSKVLL